MAPLGWGRGTVLSGASRCFGTFNGGRGAPHGDGGLCTKSKDTPGTVGRGLESYPGTQVGLQEGVPGTPDGTGASPSRLEPAPGLSLSPMLHRQGRLLAAWYPAPKTPHPKPSLPCPCGPCSASLSLGVAWGGGLSEGAPAVMAFPQTGHGVAELDMTEHTAERPANLTSVGVPPRT